MACHDQSYALPCSRYRPHKFQQHVPVATGNLSASPIRVPYIGQPTYRTLKYRIACSRLCRVTAIIDRWRLLPRRYRPEPRRSLRCLRVAHNAADYWSAPVTKPHVVVVLVPMIRATAFACGYKNQADFRMWHRWLASPLERSDF